MYFWRLNYCKHWLAALFYVSESSTHWIEVDTLSLCILLCGVAYRIGCTSSRSALQDPCWAPANPRIMRHDNHTQQQWWWYCRWWRWHSHMSWSKGCPEKSYFQNAAGITFLFSYFILGHPVWWNTLITHTRQRSHLSLSYSPVQFFIAFLLYTMQACFHTLF